ncbi:hypothetical protein PISL3812_09920 [Talaromyces islandicus]|uniref:Uncharacterized protein n=1 Tax=Talaromyces islandicus TaxID=28573 RepID=A0A0U1MBD5_TALIS|nr:hypothetical protein PISL3812_09920 [Talaromyces islandicus]
MNTFSSLFLFFFLFFFLSSSFTPLPTSLRDPAGLLVDTTTTTTTTTAMPTTMPATKVVAVAVLVLAVAVSFAVEDNSLAALAGRLDELAAVVEKIIAILELVLKALDLVKKVIDAIDTIPQWGQAKSLVFQNAFRLSSCFFFSKSPLRRLGTDKSVKLGFTLVYCISTVMTALPRCHRVEARSPISTPSLLFTIAAHDGYQGRSSIQTTSLKEPTQNRPHEEINCRPSVPRLHKL